MKKRGETLITLVLSAIVATGVGALVAFLLGWSIT